MANIQHLRVVYLNEFLHSVEKAMKRTGFARWEDPNEEMLDSVNFSIETFHKKIAKAKSKNQSRNDRAKHVIVNITKRTNTNNYNRLSSKRRKAKKNASTTT